MARPSCTYPVLAFSIVCTVVILLHRMQSTYPGDHAWSTTSVSKSSPLLIGFRANWPLLQQTVVSYIAAGWPAKDIIVVDNTGTMDANARGQLTPVNPSYLPYAPLKELGITIVTTPTQLTFAQLQNFYLFTAMAHSWPGYFWSHQDVAVLPLTPTASFHWEVQACLKKLARTSDRKLGAVFFAAEDVPNAYDSLTYMDVESARAVGGWDNAIPYYCTDWDYYSRLRMANYSTPDCRAGPMFDLAAAVDDPHKTFFGAVRPGAQKRPGDDAKLNARFTQLQELLKEMSTAKMDNGRNAWHDRQKGGRREPFSLDPKLAKHIFDETTMFGRKMFEDKWGEKNTQMMDEVGLTLDDAWKDVLERGKDE